MGAPGPTSPFDRWTCGRCGGRQGGDPIPREAGCAVLALCETCSEQVDGRAGRRPSVAESVTTEQLNLPEPFSSETERG